MNHPIFINPKSNEFYHIGKAICDLCRTGLNSRFILNCQWNKKESSLNIICLKCLPKLKQLAEVDENILVNIVDKKPLNSVPKIFTPQTLVNSSGLTTFEAVSTKSEAIIKDKTVFAGRTDFKGIEDYNRSKSVFEKRELELSEPVKEIGLFFDNVLNSNLITNKKGVKQIESNKAV